jgi:16S rRNA processing protein RimM
VAGVRVHRGQLILRLAGVGDRETADQFRGQLVQIRLAAAAPLPPGTYFHHQIIGLVAVTEAGEVLGEVSEVLETGANDVYVVTGDQGEILLPAISSVIVGIDLAARQITVQMMDGLR